MHRAPENKNGNERLSRLASAEFQQLELKSSLEATRLCNVLVIQSAKGTLRVLFSVSDNDIVQWHDVLTRLVPWLEALPYDVMICQKCMTAGGKLVAPWLLQVETPNAATLRLAVQDIRKAFMRLVNPAVDEPRRENFSWLADQFGGGCDAPGWEATDEQPDRHE